LHPQNLHLSLPPIFSIADRRLNAADPTLTEEIVFSSQDSIILGFDIGGTGMRAAPVDCQTGLLAGDAFRLPTPNPSDPEPIFEQIQIMIDHFSWRGAIGCGFPATVKGGVVRFLGNLSQKWIGVPILAELQRMTTSQVTVINDADSAALAEMHFGAGRKRNNDRDGTVLLITLGTSIGTAVFTDGHLLPHTEFGHIEIDGKIAERWAATVERERKGLSWEEWGRQVDRFLQKMELLLSPDLIIVGGGVSAAWEKFFPYLKLRAEVLPATMGNDAGIVGASLAAKIGFRP